MCDGGGVRKFNRSDFNMDRFTALDLAWTRGRGGRARTGIGPGCGHIMRSGHTPRESFSSGSPPPDITVPSGTTCLGARQLQGPRPSGRVRAVSEDRDPLWRPWTCAGSEDNQHQEATE